VNEPKDLPVRGVRPTIHLVGTAALTLNKSIAKVGSEFSGAIGASTVGDDNFGSRRSLAQMREKSPYQRRLIKNRNNNRNLHSSAFR
jgi:hypothetical protein